MSPSALLDKVDATERLKHANRKPQLALACQPDSQADALKHSTEYQSWSANR
jgi:hypothetical protein